MPRLIANITRVFIIVFVLGMFQCGANRERVAVYRLKAERCLLRRTQSAMDRLKSATSCATVIGKTFGSYSEH